MKGDQWPQIRMKCRGHKNYKPACKDLVEMAKQNLVKASKARAAERKAANDALLMDEDMETEPAPSTSNASGPASAAGTTSNSVDHANVTATNPFLYLRF